MLNLKKFLRIAGIVLGSIGIIIALFIVFNKVYFKANFIIDPNLASNFGEFFGGFVGTIFSLLSIILILYTVVNQSIENTKSDVKNRFFKMLDYHNENVKNLKVPHLDVNKKDITEYSRRVFVTYKIQIKRLLGIVTKVNLENDLNLKDEEVIDVAYICFYYGLDSKWSPFIKEKLSRYEQGNLITDKILEKIVESEPLKLGRTNQTDLSSIFRNMYNVVKIVDSDTLLTETEKKDLIKIFRAQLSNPELYVLFFNLVSRFGKKWNSNNYVIEYELLTNLPKDYCDGYDPKKFYDIQYEHEEL